MKESKYGKYIVTDLKKDIKLPGFKCDQVVRQGMVEGKRFPLEQEFMSKCTPLLLF